MTKRAQKTPAPAPVKKAPRITKSGGSAQPTADKKAVKGGKGRAGTGSPTPKKKNPMPPETRRAPKITTAQYNALQQSYFAQQSIDRAAKTAGMSWKAASYYIEGPGKPRVGMVPIRQMWLDVQAEAQEKQQLTLLKFHEDQQKELQEIIDTNLAELRLIRAEVYARVKKFRESKGQTVETGASMSSAFRSYERAVKLMERVLGAPDLTLKNANAEDRYRDWSDEEIIEYMVSGAVPEHAR